MNDIPIEILNRIDEWNASQSLAHLRREHGREIDGPEALQLAQDGDLWAISWLRALLATDKYYRREVFVKFPEDLIREIVARDDERYRARAIGAKRAFRWREDR